MEEFWNHPHFQRLEKKKQFHFMDLNRKYGHKLYIVFSMLIITHVNWTVPISFDRLLLSTRTPNLWRQDFQTQHTVTIFYYWRKSTIARINPQRRWQAWKPISLPYRPVNRNTCWTYHRLGYNYWTLQSPFSKIKQMNDENTNMETCTTPYRFCMEECSRRLTHKAN